MEYLCERCGQPVGKGERLCKECAARLVPRKPGQAGAATLPVLPDLPVLDSVPPSPPRRGGGNPSAAAAGEPAASEGNPFAPASDLEKEFSPEDMAGISAEELDAMEEAAGEKPRKTIRLVPPEGEKESEGTEPDEVDVVAGYGQAPDNIVLALPYALRVWTRRRELGQTLEGLEREKAAAAVLLDDALSELGAALHARRSESALAPLQKLFLAVREADKKIEQQEGDRFKNRQSAEEKMKELQAQLEAAEREAEPFREKEREVKQRLAEAEKNRDRARAMLQRVLIEKRALEGASEPPGQDRIDSLQAAEQARQSEVEVASARVAEVSKELSQASLELAEKMKGVSAALAARQQATDALEEEERDYENRALQAEGEKRSAFIAVAAAALNDRLLSNAEASPVLSARHHLTELEHACQVHQEALTRYDRDRYQQGIYSAAAVVAIVLALVIYLIIS
jgi:hypothetical protein